ncbi:MAG: hypothetical protein ACR2M6_02595 [Vampirovibrionia bacterium]
MSDTTTATVDRIFDKITGPFGALVISLVALYWLSEKFEVFVDKTIESHDEDRLLYKKSMEKMTDQLIDNSRKIDVLSSDVKELSDDVKSIKGE